MSKLINISIFPFQIEGPLEAGKKIPLVDIGAGVYPTTLFFNHSCAPNTLRINQGSRVRLHLTLLKSGSQGGKNYNLNRLKICGCLRSQDSLYSSFATSMFLGFKMP